MSNSKEFSSYVLGFGYDILGYLGPFSVFVLSGLSLTRLRLAAGPSNFSHNFSTSYIDVVSPWPPPT